MSRASLESLNPPKELIKRCKAYFGLTPWPSTAGYILPDGDMLDFSGYKFGSGLRTRRTVDHRKIIQCVNLGYEFESKSLQAQRERMSTTDVMHFFMKRANALRLTHTKRGDTHIALFPVQKPTSAQWKKVQQAMEEGTGNLWYDLRACKHGNTFTLGDVKRELKRCKRDS